MKEKFSEWLEANSDLSSNSCDKYVRAVKQISKEMQEKGTISLPLYSIKNSNTFKEIMDKIFQDKDFIEKNGRGNRMYSRGLEYYLKFLRSQCEQMVEVIIPHVQAYIASKGYTYDADLINNRYLSLKSKPFVILAGISGTGKSKLAKLFAEAIDAKFKLIPVRPDWSDSTDLFGYVNLKGEFQPGCLTEFIKEANKKENLSKPYIVCLDEMNLARVEHYFSDVLSVIETRELKDGRITSAPFMNETVFGNNEKIKNEYGSLYFSENLYFIGTVNMDETTFPFSKKVLDRANTIELSDVNLELGLHSREEKLGEDNVSPVPIDNKILMGEYKGLRDCYEENKKAVTGIISILTEINKCLENSNAQIAYRVRDEISYYITYALKYNLLDYDQAMDNCFMQKILPRIQGSGEEVSELLIRLFNLCIKEEEYKDKHIEIRSDSRLEMAKQLLDDSANSETAAIFRYPRSAKKIVFMLKKCEGDLGYATYWI